MWRMLLIFEFQNVKCFLITVVRNNILTQTINLRHRLNSDRNNFGKNGQYLPSTRRPKASSPWTYRHHRHGAWKLAIDLGAHRRHQLPPSAAHSQPLRRFLIGSDIHTVVESPSTTSKQKTDRFLH